MDFSLSLHEPLTALSPAQQRAEITALNGTVCADYGLTLTGEDAAMILRAGESAMRQAGLIQFGGGITPRLMHWFLPSGLVTSAAQIAALTDAFYRIKGSLQEICDEADNPECVLSDNAVLDYMYRFFVSPSCAGDVAEMLRQTVQILCGTMKRLLEQRAAGRAAEQRHPDGDPALALLYADRIQAEEAELAAEEEAYGEERYDFTYREHMHQDCFGNYLGDYGEQGYVTRGTYGEELAEVLRQHPEFLLPSAGQEAEWADRAERWEDEDAAALQQD